jgi:hypothetical protein
MVEKCTKPYACISAIGIYTLNCIFLIIFITLIIFSLTLITMIKRTVAARLLQATLLAANTAKHPKVKKQMELFGYPAARMQQLHDLIAQAEAFKDDKKEFYSQKGKMAKQMAAEVKALKAMYKEHLTIARFAFRNDPYLQGQLELKGGRKSDWAGWLGQVGDFYTKAETLALPALKKQGVTAEEIARGNAMAQALTAAYEDKKSTKGNAQSSTKKRDEVLKAIDVWIRNFKKVAQVALQDDPQLLEVLGMVVPSAK